MDSLHSTIGPIPNHKKQELGPKNEQKLVPRNFTGIQSFNHEEARSEKPCMYLEQNGIEVRIVRKYVRNRIGAQPCLEEFRAVLRLLQILPKQNKMSENSHESKVEMVISTVLKLVFILYFGHFILFRYYI